jgi:hypothetical protein
MTKVRTQASSVKGVGSYFRMVGFVSLLLLWPGIMLGAKVMVTSATHEQPLSPQWAFDGAYATYSGTFTYNGSTARIQITSSMSDLNLSAQTYLVTAACSGSYCSVLQSGESNGTGSFDEPNFPAVSLADLASLSAGKSTGEFLGTVTSNVTLTVPAGAAKADMVVVPDEGTVWIDTMSGLLLQEVVTPQSSIQGVSGPFEFQLVATNIPISAATGSSIWVSIIGLVATVACVVGVVVYLALRKPGKVIEATGPAAEAESAEPVQ